MVGQCFEALRTVNLTSFESLNSLPPPFRHVLLYIENFCS